VNIGSALHERTRLPVYARDVTNITGLYQFKPKLVLQKVCSYKNLTKNCKMCSGHSIVNLLGCFKNCYQD
jgi:hypothetical protein